MENKTNTGAIPAAGGDVVQGEVTTETARFARKEPKSGS